MFCSKCGKQLDNAAKFCGSCGASVETSIVDGAFESKQVDVKPESTLRSEEQTKPVAEGKKQKPFPKWVFFIVPLCLAVCICLAFLIGFPEDKTEVKNKSPLSSESEDSDYKDVSYKNDAERIVGEWLLEMDFGIFSEASEDVPDLDGISLEIGLEFTKTGRYKFEYDWDSIRDCVENFALRAMEDKGMTIEEFEEEKGAKFDEYIDMCMELLQKAFTELVEKQGSGDYEIKNDYLHMSDGEKIDQYEYEFKGDDTLIIYLGEESGITKLVLERE